MTIPKKPTSSKQRYVTTETGKEVLKTENCANISSLRNKKETNGTNT